MSEKKTPTPYQYTREQLDAFKKLAETLGEVVPWGKTPQGFQYWQGVHDELIVLSKCYMKRRPRRPHKRVLIPQDPAFRVTKGPKDGA